MLEKILIFILFLGPLVFFHELGHFFFARLFGVRVETFSIGFGPKLFKIKKGFTEYCVSLIPLGGYVKMFGDDPLNKDEVSPEDRKHAFTHKGKWARFWIVIGGPLANFILAYALFFGLLIGGEKVPEIRVGAIPQNSKLHETGLRAGDSLRRLNGKMISSPTDIALEGSTKIETLTIERNGEDVQLAINMKGDKFFNEFMKYPPLLRKPYVYNKQGERFIVALEGERPQVETSLDEFSVLQGGKTFELYQIPKVYSEKNLGEQNLKMSDSFTVSSAGHDAFFEAMLEQGYLPQDLGVKSIQQGSAAEEAGLKMGDVIVSLNGENLWSFEWLRETLQETEDKKVQLGVWREGELQKLSIQPEVKTQNGEEVKLIGVYSNADFVSMSFIQTESKGFFGSLVLAAPRTWDITVKTVEGFKKLFTAEVSLKTIGGPIAIGKVASDSFNTSLSYFFQLMALISVNLGIINLLPIPVLDGGHIMFIFLEVINRGPMSRRKMEIAQQVGLSLLLLLMFGAIFNDVSRFF